MNFNDLANELIAPPEPKGYDVTAQVVRVEDGTAYVHIDGGAPETPAKMTISAKAGDLVKIRVSNGTAWITGNESAPPTDDTKADLVARSVQAVNARINNLFAQDIEATGTIRGLKLKGSTITGANIVGSEIHMLSPDGDERGHWTANAFVVRMADDNGITAEFDVTTGALIFDSTGSGGNVIMNGSQILASSEGKKFTIRNYFWNSIVINENDTEFAKPIKVCGTKLVYEKGDTFAFGDGGSAFVSGVLNDNKTVFIDIPLDKPLASDVTGVTVTGFKANIMNNGTRILGTGANAGAAAPTAINARILRRNAINLTLTIAQTSTPIGAVGVHVPFGTIKFT